MTRAITLLLVAAFAVGCSKDDDSGKKRDKSGDRDDDDDRDRKKKKRDRDDDDDKDGKKRRGDKERDEDLEDDILKGLARYRDDMCDCKDAACGDKVHNDFRDWRKSLKAKIKGVEKPPERVMKQITKIQGEFDDCRKKLKSDKPPLTPP